MLPCFNEWFSPAPQFDPRPDVLGTPTPPMIGVCWGSQPSPACSGQCVGALVLPRFLFPYPESFRLLPGACNLMTLIVNRRQPRDGLHVRRERSWGGECHEPSMPGGRAVNVWLQPCCTPQGPASGLAVGRLRGQHRLRLPLRQGIRGRTRKGTNPRQGFL